MEKIYGIFQNDSLEPAKKTLPKNYITMNFNKINNLLQSGVISHRDLERKNLNISDKIEVIGEFNITSLGSSDS